LWPELCRLILIYRLQSASGYTPDEVEEAEQQFDYEEVFGPSGK